MLDFHTQNYWRLRDKDGNASLLDRMRGLEGVEPDQDQQVTKSPNTEQAIRSYLEADDPAIGRDAFERVLQGWRADNASAGVSVLSHDPMPKDFGDAVARQLGTLTAPDRDSVLNHLLSRSEPGLRLHVTRQLDDLLARNAPEPGLITESGAAEHNLMDENAVAPQTIGRSMFVSDVADKANLEGGNRLFVGAPGDAGARRSDELRELSPEPLGFGPRGPQSSSGQDPRIVKPYRKYQTPGVDPNNDTEMQDADQLALEADKSIWPAMRALNQDRSFRSSSNRLDREFDAVMHRFFSPGSDRAVVGVGTRYPETSLRARDRYATYDPSSDRIYFAKTFQGLSGAERIITVIHEVLHATVTIRNWEARLAYNPNTADEMTVRAHEAEIDRIAIAYAKRLGLIPANYPSP